MTRVAIWVLLGLLAGCGASTDGDDDEADREAACEALMQAGCSKLVECRAHVGNSTELFSSSTCRDAMPSLVDRCMEKLVTSEPVKVDACVDLVSMQTCADVCGGVTVRGACDAVYPSAEGEEDDGIPCEGEGG